MNAYLLRSGPNWTSGHGESWKVESEPRQRIVAPGLILPLLCHVRITGEQANRARPIQRQFSDVGGLRTPSLAMEPEPSTQPHSKSDSHCEGVILALSDAASASEDETTVTS